MAKPVINYIAENLRDLMLTITKVNGYEQDIRQSSLKTAASSINFSSYPAVDFIGKVRKTDESDHGWQVCILEVSIGVYTDDTIDVPEALSKLVADIEKALAVDGTRGGYALDTAVTDIDYEYMTEHSEADFTGFASIGVEVEFEHPRDDPYSVS